MTHPRILGTFNMSSPLCDECSYRIACEMLSPGFRRPPISDDKGNIYESEACYRLVKAHSDVTRWRTFGSTTKQKIVYSNVQLIKATERIAYIANVTS